MVALSSLWLPIIVASVLVFLVSFILWAMLPGWHSADVRAVTYESELSDALGRQHLSPGFYGLPKPANREAAKSEEYRKKLQAGPVAWITVVRPGGFNMSKLLFAWFIYILVVSFVSAYVASRTIAPPANDYLHVFRVVGTFAVFAYAAGTVPNGIWWGKPWNLVIKDVVDGVIYGLVTAGAFGWLWPR